MAVSEQEVRDLLDTPAATSVSADTINANINRSTNLVNSFKDSDAVQVKVDDAVTAIAVWLTYGSYMEGITMQLGAVSLADQVKLDHLKKTAELFANSVSSTFVDLDPANMDQNLVGIDPKVFILSTTEAFKQE